MYFYAWINYSRKLTNRKSVGKIDNMELCDFDVCEAKMKLLTMGITHNHKM